MAQKVYGFFQARPKVTGKCTKYLKWCDMKMHNMQNQITKYKIQPQSCFVIHSTIFIQNVVALIFMWLHALISPIQFEFRPYLRSIDT